LSVPELDQELRLRLVRRFGTAVDAWFEALPAVLADLEERWQLEWGEPIARGSMSVVIRCRAEDGRPAVLKITPERARLAREAAALACWATSHVPAVLAVDEGVGALLLEAIEPGTPLVESAGYPRADDLVALMTSLHDAGDPGLAFPPVAERIAYLFESSRKLYERKPELRELISPELYDDGRALALRLAADPIAPALLHGDLTPVNVLDGGGRSLVAIDPAPCVGDPAFDAIDFVMWRATDTGTIGARAEQLAAGIGAEPDRLLDWCAAFAGMTALEIAEAPGGSREEVEPFVTLASRARR
jgi:streptomycin 6-kinase